MKRKLCIALLVVFAAVFVFSAVNFCSLLVDYQKANELYENVQHEYVSDPVDESSDAGDTDAHVPNKETVIAVDFEGLQKINPDVIGWIYAPGTDISYPVVQGESNQTYLHKGLDGAYLRSGSIFADYRNQGPTVDRNFIVYGHSMKNGSMFGMLLQYKKQSYYDEHPVWYYLTPDQNYRVELFAGRVVKTDHIVYQTQPNNEAFSEYVQDSVAASTFESDVTVTDDDAVITLSTCSYEFDQARYVVMGKLVPIE